MYWLQLSHDELKRTECGLSTTNASVIKVRVLIQESGFLLEEVVDFGGPDATVPVKDPSTEELVDEELRRDIDDTLMDNCCNY